MVFPAKPGVDWTLIRAEYEQGASVKSLARTHGLQRSTIQKRRDREGWPGAPGVPKSPEQWRHAATQLDIVGQDRAGSKRNTDTVAQILKALESGMPLQAAARLAGMAPETLSRWRQSDQAFTDLCTEATERWHLSRIQDIDKAAKRGDWRAAAYRLERNPTTRETYAQQSQAQQAITVVVNVTRDNPEPVTVIDMTAKVVEIIPEAVEGETTKI